MAENEKKFVSRAGNKLDAALDAFGVDCAGLVCADFGCNVGGFTDCMLQRGAEHVFAIDTGYGKLAWTLRKDPRVTVMERTNALHCEVAAQVDLVVIDVGWTPQVRAIPAAMQWLKPGGQIVSLLKPHFELTKLQKRKPHAALTDEQSQDVVEKVTAALAELGYPPAGVICSPLIGKGGNHEYLLHFHKA